MLRAAVPALIAAGVCGVIAIVWDFYYDLNDDTMMAAILSGAYTGTPALRNIQSYFPLTALLGALQRLISFVPWYGVFLTAMPFVCLYLVLRRIGTITAAPGGSGGRPGDGPGLSVPGEDGERIPRQNRTMTWTARTAYGAVAVLLFAGMMLYHLVFIQYSVVVGIMGATAAFLFLTMEPKESAWAWTKEILPQLILIWLGFLLRSEMMLFVSPFIALAFLIRLLDMDLSSRRGRAGAPEPEEGGTGKTDCPQGGDRMQSGGGKRPERTLTKPSAALLTLALVFAGLAAGYLGNLAGYASEEWQEFYEFFDARTELYDFQKLPEYEGNEEFYESIGLDEAEAALIINYNFGLDEDIDAQVIAQIAEYAAKKAAEEETVMQRIQDAIWDYQHAFSSGTEQPYNTIALLLYILAFAVVLERGIHERLLLRRGRTGQSGKASKEGAALKPLWRLLLRTAELAVLFAGRSVLLLYLYYNNRPVVRLTHSIYLAEAVILVWMILESLPAGRTAPSAAGAAPGAAAADAPARAGAKVRDAVAANDAGKRRRKGIRIGRSADPVIREAITGLVIVIFSCALVMQVRDVCSEYASREEVNGDWTAFMEYCASNPDKVYFTDVYSTVSFSEKIFDRQEEAVNYVILGGWVSKSPLEERKLAYLGLSGSVEESLLEEGCCLASKSSYDVSWLAEYYACKGIEVDVTAVDTVGEFWTIYEVTAADASE